MVIFGSFSNVHPPLKILVTPIHLVDKHNNFGLRWILQAVTDNLAVMSNLKTNSRYYKSWLTNTVIPYCIKLWHLYEIDDKYTCFYRKSQQNVILVCLVCHIFHSLIHHYSIKTVIFPCGTPRPHTLITKTKNNYLRTYVVD